MKTTFAHTNALGTALTIRAREDSRSVSSVIRLILERELGVRADAEAGSRIKTPCIHGLK